MTKIAGNGRVQESSSLCTARSIPNCWYLPRFLGKAVHQSVLPGDRVPSIDQDGEGTRGEAGLIKDRVKGMP